MGGRWDPARRRVRLNWHEKPEGPWDSKVFKGPQAMAQAQHFASQIRGRRLEIQYVVYYERDDSIVRGLKESLS